MTKDIEQFRRPKRHIQEHPKGFEPGVQWEPGKGGHLTVIADSEPDSSIWLNLIEDWDLDPNQVSVVEGSVQVRAWDSNMGDGQVKRFKYYRATLKPKGAELSEVREDIDALCKLVEKRKPGKTKINDIGERSFLWLWSDLQAGKGEGGGSEAMINRMGAALEHTVFRLDELRKAGRPVSTVYIVGLGDLIESCMGHYAMQAWQADLDRRQQCKLVRRLILEAVNKLTDLGYSIVLAAVPGNHGENRNNDGKAFTNFSDNDDVAIFEQVAEILAANPERYANVFVPTGALDREDLVVTLNIANIPCAFAHGHQFRSGTNAPAKAENWWKGQALGRQPVADAELLFSGHFHHFCVSEATGRTWFQSPAQDGGSNWFTYTSGNSSPAGMLTLCVGDSYPRGWGDLQIV